MHSRTIRVYRDWGEHWTSYPTYRYVGINTLSFIHWYQSRWGYHTDYAGRLSVYLGWIRLWQDVVRCRHNPHRWSSRWVGPFEVVWG